MLYELLHNKQEQKGNRIQQRNWVILSGILKTITFLMGSQALDDF